MRSLGWVIISLIGAVLNFESVIKINNYDFELGAVDQCDVVNSSMARLVKEFRNIYSKKGKLIYFDDEENFRKAMLRYVNYNSRWFIMLDNEANYQDALSFIEKDKVIMKDKEEIDFYPRALIINKDKVRVDSVSLEVAYLMVSTSEFDKLKADFEINNEKENVFSNIIIRYSGIAVQKQTSQYLLLSLSLILIIVYITSKLFINKLNIEATNLFKFILAMSMFYIVVTLFIFYYVLINGDLDDLTTSASLLITIVYSLFTIFKAILCYLLFIISFGWEVYISAFTRSEIKFLLAMFISIYVLMSIELLVSFLNTNFLFWNFTLADIKNILFFCSILTYFTYCSIRGIRLLKVRFMFIIDFRSNLMKLQPLLLNS